MGWINVAKDRDKWQAVSTTFQKNAGECLESLRNYQFLKEDCAAWN